MKILRYLRKVKNTKKCVSIKNTGQIDTVVKLIKKRTIIRVTEGKPPTSYSFDVINYVGRFYFNIII